MSFPILPKWAVDDVVDPISQQQNVVAPPTEKENDGWFLGEKPNRQWWNWLARQTYLCLEDLQTRVTNIVADADAAGIAFVPVINGLDNVIVNEGYYHRQGNKIFIQLHITYSSNTLTAPISIVLPFAGITDTDFLQTLNVKRVGITTLPNGVALSGLITSASTIAELWGENLTTGASGAVSSIAGDSGQLSINGFYYAEPV